MRKLLKKIIFPKSDGNRLPRLLAAQDSWSFVKIPIKEKNILNLNLSLQYDFRLSNKLVIEDESA